MLIIKNQISINKCRKKKSSSGFTLIEFVMVIIISGLLSYVAFGAFTLPFQSFEDVSRRADLVALADTALMQMSRDIRSAVPNSVRVAQSGNIYSLELLRSPIGGRYRYVDDATDSVDNALSPGNADSTFNVMGNIGSPASTSRIVINSMNSSALYAAAVSGSGGIISPASTTLTVTAAGAEQELALSSAYQFDTVGLGSTQKRFYVTDTAITYRCDPGSNEIRRYVNYNVTTSQTTAIPSGADSDLLVNSVSDCEFIYNSGTSARAGLTTLSLTLSQVKTYSSTAVQAQESINLIQQVHVNNVP